MLVLGVAYKKDISDMRESPALDIIALLQAKGADVIYHDPHVPSFREDGHELRSEDDLDAALASADCTVVVTDHSEYDWDRIAEKARLVVDTRRAVKAKPVAA